MADGISGPDGADLDDASAAFHALKLGEEFWREGDRDLGPILLRERIGRSLEAWSLDGDPLGLASHQALALEGLAQLVLADVVDVPRRLGFDVAFYGGSIERALRPNSWIAPELVLIDEALREIETRLDDLWWRSASFAATR